MCETAKVSNARETFFFLARSQKQFQFPAALSPREGTNEENLSASMFHLLTICFLLDCLELKGNCERVTFC